MSDDAEVDKNQKMMKMTNNLELVTEEVSVVAAEYNCNECDAKLATKKSFVSHMAVHSEDFKCQTCGNCFGSMFSLQRHLKNVHKVEAETVKESDDIKVLTVEDDDDDDDQDYHCDVCDKYFSTNDRLKEHKSDHEREKMIKKVNPALNAAPRRRSIGR